MEGEHEGQREGNNGRKTKIKVTKMEGQTEKTKKTREE